jgi:bacterioferritin-associated ferredoxin
VIVCHCRAVSDRTLRARIAEGATTVEALREATGASECCGGCEPTVTAILDQELSRDPSSTSPVRAATFRPLRVVRDPRAA